jgi:hypothetical protein
VTTDIPHLELGHALITMIEPEPATLAEYNDWYERDHSLSGVMTGPGAFSMRRFVATRDLKALRAPADSPIARPLAEGSFIALYWFERDQLTAHADWGFPETARLHGLGRMRTDRRHVSTAYYDLVGATGRGAKPVPMELALAHPYDALVMIWTSAPTGHDGAAAGLRASLVDDTSPIGNVVTFREAPVDPMPGAIIGETAVDPATVLAHAAFVNGAVDEALVGRITSAIAAAGLTPLLVAPFVPTVPGTDIYLDQLW